MGNQTATNDSTPGITFPKPRHNVPHLIPKNRSGCKTKPLLKNLIQEFLQETLLGGKNARLEAGFSCAKGRRKKARHTPRPASSYVPYFAPGNVVEVYQRHYRDIRERMPQDAVFDCSRVDSMIAVRLRVTGHSEAEIRDTVLQCAPGIRNQTEGRNWNEYAQRTAAYAFSFQGDRQVDNLSKYRQQWLALEGRAERQEQKRQQEQIYERPSRSMGMGR